MEKGLIKRNKRRVSRAKRVRKAIKARGSTYRLSVSKTNKHIFAQIIDDESGTSFVGVGTRSKEIRETEFAKKGRKSAEKIGQILAEKAKEKKITSVFFDRGRYKYHGIVAAIADGARNGGLKF